MAWGVPTRAPRRIYPTGSRMLHTWERRPEYRRENGGLGMCNTGSGKRIVCAMGGSGCDVDHVAIARGNLKWWRSLRRWVTRRGDLEAYEGATADGDHWVEVAEI
jgi:hypothetical protein